MVKFTHSFIHVDLYNASSRDYYSEAFPAQSRPKKKDFREMYNLEWFATARNAAQKGDHSMLTLGTEVRGGTLKDTTGDHRIHSG